MYYYTNNTTNSIYNNYNTNYHQLIAMGNSNASHNRLQISPYTNAPPALPPSINMNNEASNGATPYYATYQTLRQLVRPPYHQTNENVYMRNQQQQQQQQQHQQQQQPQPQAPHSQLPQLPLLVHQISNYPSEPQQQQQHQVHHLHQHAFIQTMQKGSHLNYHKSERNLNQDKHLDALVGLILPTKNASSNNNNNVTSKIYSSSNSKENTLRKAHNKSSANYSPKYQVHSSSSSKQHRQQEIFLEKTNSSEYFFSNRDEKKKVPQQQRKNVLTCRSQETGANCDEINKGNIQLFFGNIKNIQFVFSSLKRE